MATWKRPIVTMPRYMARFRCIGGDCEASCCSASWNISVDEKTARKVKDKAPEPLRTDFTTALKRLKDEKGKPRLYVKEHSDGPCSMLNEEGGCRIQTAMGAGALPATCYVFPRVLLRVDHHVKVFADFSCPESIRLGLFDPNALDVEAADFDPLLMNRVTGTNIDTAGQHHRDVIEEVRKFCHHVFLDRSLPFWQRVCAVGMTFDLMEKAKADVPNEKVIEVIQAVQQRVDNGTLAQQLQGVQGNPLQQLRALMPLIERWLTNKIGVFLLKTKGDSAPLIQDLAYALHMDKGGQATVDAYTEAFNSYYAPWAEQNPHVIENLFRISFEMRGLHARLHHGQDAFWNEGVVFALTRMLLVAQAARRGKEFGEADVVPVVMAVWRSIHHNPAFVQDVREAFEAAGCATLTHLCALLAPIPGPNGKPNTFY